MSGTESSTDVTIAMPSKAVYQRKSMSSIGEFRTRVTKLLGIPTKEDSLVGITRQRSWACRHSPLLVRMVEHTYFECVVGLLIAFNCVTIGMEVQYCPAVDSLRWMPPDDSPLAGVSLSDRLTRVQNGEYGKYEPSRDCPANFLQITEYLLTGLFVIEFFLRVLVYSKYYYLGSVSKFLDACLVWVTGFFVVCILEPLDVQPGRVRMFTMFRAFRLIRVARLVQGNPMLKEAWLLVKGLAESVRTLFWTVVVIFFVNFAFAIVAVIMIGDSNIFTCANASEDLSGNHEECAYLADDKDVHEYFNGLGNTMFTLLQIMTGDSWASGIARPVMRFQPYVWVFFILYVAVAMLVMLNLVTAVIVENALDISKQDERQKLIDLQQNKKNQIASIKRIFAALDVDGSGAIDESEFIDACTNKQDIMNKFRLLDFDEAEILNLFKDLEVSDDGLLSLEEFEDGLNSMQGEARNKDLVRIQKSIQRLNQHVEKLSNHLPVKESSVSGSADGTPLLVHHATAFGKRMSRGRSESPVRKSTPKSSASPSSANCAQVSSTSSFRRSLPGLPVPGIHVDGCSAPLKVDLLRLDPSVRDLADFLVNHLGGVEQRMDQKLAILEHRQASALQSIASHLKIGPVHHV